MKSKIQVLHTKSKGLSYTNFLTPIYLGTGVEYEKITKPKDAGADYVFLGHGDHRGLINDACNGYSISPKNVQVLREANSVVGLWCKSSSFARRYNISGVWFGMFISDLDEMIDNLGSFDKKHLEESNNLITVVMKEAVKLRDNKSIYNYIRSNYASGNNLVIQFNSNKLTLI